MNKISVLIADDEEFICVLLQKVILWDELNLELIGFVHDGSHLYEEIVSKRPDIVITDICMPQINGIELIGRIRNENIPCRFIIVSGYRQFAYAHDALKYDVDDYILKPVDSKELNETLKKLSTQISNQNQKEFQDHLKQRESNEHIKKFFLRRIISELTPNNSNLEQLWEEYQIPFQDGFYQMIYIKSSIKGEFEDFLDTADSVQDKLEYLFSEMFSPLCHVVLFDKISRELHIGINYESNAKVTIKNTLNEYFEKARNIVDLFKDYKITVGVGEPYHNIWCWYASALEAEYAVLSSFIHGIGKIIYWENEKSRQDILLFSTEKETEFFKGVHQSYEILDEKSFLQLTSRLFQNIKRHFSSSELKRISEKIVEEFFQTCRDLIEKYGNEDYLRKQIFFSTLQATTLQEYENALQEPIANSIRNLKENVKSQNTRPVRGAIRFIEEHYMENISLEDVAESVGLNAAYLSNIFKSITGKNYLEYLTECRMEHAKMILRTTNQSIKETALSLGYTDTHYFSKLFKKIVGIKPTDYRKIYG